MLTAIVDRSVFRVQIENQTAVASSDKTACETIQDIPEIIEEILNDYYSKNFPKVLSRLTEDCLFIGICDLFCKYPYDIERCIAQDMENPLMLVRNCEFTVAGNPPHDATEAVVIGTYSTYTAPNEPQIHASNARLTACLRLESGRWLAYHVHVSNVWSELTGDDRFPFSVSKATYDYVKEILRTGNKTGLLPSRITLEFGRNRRLVDPNEIMYVKAHGKRCVIHCMGDEFSVPALLREVVDQLPGTFVKVHRSYLVNSTNVQSLQRSSVTMIDGSEIPLPEKRYTAVRREILNRVAQAAEDL